MFHDPLFSLQPPADSKAAADAAYAVPSSLIRDAEVACVTTWLKVTAITVVKHKEFHEATSSFTFDRNRLRLRTLVCRTEACADTDASTGRHAREETGVETNTSLDSERD